MNILSFFGFGLASSNPSCALRGALALAVAFVSAVAPAPAAAGDVPSCYAANGIPAPAIDSSIFVLIDQTTMLNDDLRNNIMSNVGGLLRPGTAFTVARFSAFAQGRYLSIVKAGELEPVLTDESRNGVKIRLLKVFDDCMDDQLNFGLQMAHQAITQALAGASPSLTRSDVQASIKALSAVVRASTAKDRVVLIVSDMLENSSVSSFYANKNVRRLNASDEMTIAKTSGMIGDFAGARVYVMGAGIVPEPAKGKGIYRDPKTMNALKSFWMAYFKASNAEIVEFGQPALLTPVKGTHHD